MDTHLIIKILIYWVVLVAITQIIAGIRNYDSAIRYKYRDDWAHNIATFVLYVPLIIGGGVLFIYLSMLYFNLC